MEKFGKKARKENLSRYFTAIYDKKSLAFCNARPIILLYIASAVLLQLSEVLDSTNHLRSV